MRRQKTKPQTATVVSLWFCSLLACPELYCNWSVHNQHSLKFSGAHGFLSLSVMLFSFPFTFYTSSALIDGSELQCSRENVLQNVAKNKPVRVICFVWELLAMAYGLPISHFLARHL